MNQILLSKDLGNILDDIHPSWKKIIFSKELKPEVDACLCSLADDLAAKGVTLENIKRNGLKTYIRPAPENIFEAFKYFDANNLRCIVIGQDPYPDATHAHGLSFSSKGDHIPASLKNIYKCLYKNGLISTEPNTSNLTNWAKQGVLMLNVMLTRTPNILRDDNGLTYINGNGGTFSNCNHAFWTKFTTSLLKYLSTVWLQEICHMDNKEIIVMLWGGHAQKMASFCNQKPNKRGSKFTVASWGHPSSLNRANHDHKNENAFINCEHFQIVSQLYPEIVWDPAGSTIENLIDQFWQIRCNLGPDPQFQDVNIDWLLNTSDRRRIYNDHTDTDENRKIINFIKKQIAIKKQTSVQKQIAIKKPTSAQSDARSNRRIVVFTDGGCRGNGKRNAIGAMGVYFPTKFQGNQTATGMIKIGRNIPNCVLKYDSKVGEIISTTEKPRTNQRAELLASIHAFKTMHDRWDEWILSCDVSDILFVTDSLKYVVSWVGTRMYKEYKKDRKFTGIANDDLVRILCRFMWTFGRKVLQHQNQSTKIYSFADVEKLFVGGFLKVQHQYSHQTNAQKLAMTVREMEFVAGNECADELCNAAMNAFVV